MSIRYRMVSFVFLVYISYFIALWFIPFFSELLEIRRSQVCSHIYIYDSYCITMVSFIVKYYLWWIIPIQIFNYSDHQLNHGTALHGWTPIYFAKQRERAALVLTWSPGSNTSYDSRKEEWQKWIEIATLQIFVMRFFNQLQRSFHC